MPYGDSLEMVYIPLLQKTATALWASKANVGYLCRT